MYKLHLLQHPDWHRTGTSYCYFYIFEIIHHHSVIFSKTYPSFLTVKEGSTFLTKPLFPQEREDVTALRCSEPLRYKVGGPSKVYAIFCGMGPPGASRQKSLTHYLIQLWMFNNYRAPSMILMV